MHFFAYKINFSFVRKWIISVFVKKGTKSWFKFSFYTESEQKLGVEWGQVKSFLLTPHRMQIHCTKWFKYPKCIVSSQNSDWAISCLHIEKKIQLLKNCWDQLHPVSKNSGICQLCSTVNILMFDCNGHGHVSNTEIHLDFVRIQTEETSEALKKIADDHIHLPVRQRDKVKGEDYFLSKTKSLHVLFNTSSTHYHTHTTYFHL